MNSFTIPSFISRNTFFSEQPKYLLLVVSLTSCHFSLYFYLLKAKQQIRHWFKLKQSNKENKSTNIRHQNPQQTIFRDFDFQRRYLQFQGFTVLFLKQRWDPGQDYTGYSTVIQKLKAYKLCVKDITVFKSLVSYFLFSRIVII